MSFYGLSNHIERDRLRISNGASMRAARAVDVVAGHLGMVKPIVFISGFWRSGTTWLQELLASSLHAKTVFEPLCPENRPWRRYLVAAGVVDWESQEAFIPGRTDPQDQLWQYLDAAFLGATSSSLSVKCRGSVSESFRRAIIVKDVRLQLNLATVHDRYSVPVVHMRRHPCAIVSSLISANWTWSFDAVRLANLIAPFHEDLLDEDILGAVADGQFDDDAISRIAAYWAITERLADRIARDEPWATILAYEDAVHDPVGTIQNLCKMIGRQPSMIGNPDVDSASTNRSSRGTPSKDRPYAWRSRLASSDIDRIYRIVEAIFPDALSGVHEQRRDHRLAF